MCAKKEEDERKEAFTKMTKEKKWKVLKLFYFVKLPLAKLYIYIYINLPFILKRDFLAFSIVFE